MGRQQLRTSRLFFGITPSVVVVAVVFATIGHARPFDLATYRMVCIPVLHNVIEIGYMACNSISPCFEWRLIQADCFVSGLIP
jgi:hypothetical protein